MNCVDDCEYREMLDDANADLQELKAENAKLRGERDHWHVEQVHAYSNWEDAHKRAIELEVENAKLRDFAKLYLDAAGVDCGICPYRDPELCDTETDPMRDGCRLWEEMRKLGVEVGP